VSHQFGASAEDLLTRWGDLAHFPLACRRRLSFDAEEHADHAHSMSQNYKSCQSCGMPLKRDEKGGGTNGDGSKNTMYCSHCYQLGKFTMPDASAGEMQALVKQKLKEMGFPGFIAGFFTRGIPKLERWRTG